MQFARINGIAIHYQVMSAGKPGRPTLVFSNSLGTDFRIWRDVIVQIAGEVNIIVYDTRGHGLSDTGSTPYRIEDHVADLAGLLDVLEVRSAIICGLSVGGLIAQGLYKARPDLVRGLVLSNTAHKIGTADMWEARISAATTEGIASISDSVLERWFSPAYRRSGSAEFSGYRNMLERQPVAGYAGTCAAIAGADFTGDLENIAVPVLCIAGEKDGATPPDLVRSMAERIPGARFELIEDAGHLPCIEKPQDYARLLQAFIAKLPPGGK